jgi:hypothetical protein
MNLFTNTVLIPIYYYEHVCHFRRHNWCSARASANTRRTLSSGSSPSPGTAAAADPGSTDPSPNSARNESVTPSK